MHKKITGWCGRRHHVLSCVQNLRKDVFAPSVEYRPSHKGGHLHISVGELAGLSSHNIRLTGEWWASWQTSKDGQEVITLQEVRFRQEGERIEVETTTRGIPIEEGGYHWRGELRIWDNEVLMGWYAATDGSVRSKGTLYFVLHPHGQRMSGRWVGMSYDGKIVSGWGAMARDADDATAAIEDLKRQEHGLERADV